MALFTNKNVSDDIVYAVTKTLHDNKAALIALLQAIRSFRPQGICRLSARTCRFHPGALKYYKEIGIAPK